MITTQNWSRPFVIQQAIIERHKSFWLLEIASRISPSVWSRTISNLSRVPNTIRETVFYRGYPCPLWPSFDRARTPSPHFHQQLRLDNASDTGLAVRWWRSSSSPDPKCKIVSGSIVILQNET